MRAEAIVDVSAIKFNVELLKKTSGTKLLAVVKADAYGHGLVPVAHAALSAGADYLGVALLEEAVALREAGITAPILAWLVQPGSDFSQAIALDIDIAAASLKALSEIAAASRRMQKKARVHLEVDTGMTRGGFLAEWDQLDSEHVKDVEIVGIFSHFARADEPNEAQNKKQLDNFEARISELNAKGINPIRHISNTAATFSNRDARLDMVRVGIAMYGLSPLGRNENYQPIMKVRARLVLVKELPAGHPIGYGATVATQRDTKIGIVGMGYADGIPRIAHDAGIWFSGHRAPIIGRVSMDQFVVDLGAGTKAKSGDWVTIFGNGSHGEYTADDWGAASGSINYEIVTRIGPRVPRIYSAHVY